MYNQTDKEKFISMMVSNVGYFNKDLAVKDIVEFMRANPSFTPRQAIRKVSNDTYFSFIELTGFVQINKIMVEMYIGVPKSYPRDPPMFLIAFNDQYFYVNDQQKLLQNQLIAFEKNERNETFIRLRFPLIQKQWKPNAQSLNNIYISLMNILNHPPLLRQKNEQKKEQKEQSSASQKSSTAPKLNSNEVTKMTGNLYNDITELLIAKTSLSDASIEIDYNVCRSYFLANHLPELKATIRSKAQEFNRGTEIIQNNLMDMKANKNCDFLLETSEEGKIKLDLLCEQQALKDGEIQLRSIIEHDESAKFADYKKIMKILYDRMFDNQTSILLQSK